MKFISILLVCLLLLTTVVPVVTSVTEEKYGGTLRMVVGWESPTLIPAITWVSCEIGPYPMFDSLVYYDLNWKLQPALAESWDVSPDGRNITLHLRKDVYFHDGVKMTSADVKFTLENVIKPYHSLGASIFAPLESIETPDNYTVVLNLKYAFPPIWNGLATDACWIIPKHLYENTDILTNPYNFKPVGTGPFKFVEYVRGSHFIMERNENYWKPGRPYLDKIIVYIVPDASLRMLMIEKGMVDMAGPWSLPVSEIKRIENLKGWSVDLTPAAWAPVERIQYNLRRSITGNIMVRKAIAWAIDRNYLFKNAYFEAGHVGTGPIGSPQVTLYEPNVTLYDTGNRTKNLEIANNLLDQAGYPRGEGGIRFSLTLTYPAPRAATEKAVEIIKEQLREVGIDIKLQALDPATLTDVCERKWDFDMYVYFRATGPSPEISVRRLYHSTEILPLEARNSMGFNNSRVDQLLDLASRETNETKRIEYWKEFQRIITDQLPTFELWEYPYPIAHKDEYHNIRDNYIALSNLANLWWEGGVLPTQPTAAVDLGVPLAISIALNVILLTSTGYFWRKKRPT